ncbi:MAG TPA: DUF2182 domain-containing protein [Roseiflexaceae bacterium]|nr:DUF2182 domain-containing protein [Roseiflexaceae bacterium]
MLINSKLNIHHSTLLFAGLCGAAWVALLWGGGPVHMHVAGAGGLLAFAAGWAVMTAAMMLPTAAPLTLLFARLVRRRPDRRWLVALLLLGYLAAWLLFGLVARAGYAALDALAAAWISPPAWAVSAALLGLAGLYQFSPLKYRCLDECRSPMHVITAHWTGRDYRRQALLLGAHHGLFCVGCCWALMLLMFAVGAGSQGWMLALATAMGLEKNAPWGRRLGPPLGALLLAGALFVLLSATLLPPAGPADALYQWICRR